MARTENDTVFKEVIEVILQNGLEGLPDALSIIINEAMRVERSRTLQAGPYERSETRIGYANGYKPKTLNSRVGQLFLSVPQVRGEGGGSVCQYHFGTRLKVVSHPLADFLLKVTIVNLRWSPVIQTLVRSVMVVKSHILLKVEPALPNALVGLQIYLR